jgi:hypothetical protein
VQIGPSLVIQAFPIRTYQFFGEKIRLRDRGCE